jgi:hypothetical protein
MRVAWDAVQVQLRTRRNGGVTAATGLVCPERLLSALKCRGYLLGSLSGPRQGGERQRRFISVGDITRSKSYG